MAVVFASNKNCSRRLPEPSISGRITFRATFRPNCISRARYTSPIPPRPRVRITRKWSKSVPGAPSFAITCSPSESNRERGRLNPVLRVWVNPTVSSNPNPSSPLGRGRFRGVLQGLSERHHRSETLCTLVDMALNGFPNQGPVVLPRRRGGCRIAGNSYPERYWFLGRESNGHSRTGYTSANRLRMESELCIQERETGYGRIPLSQTNNRGPFCRGEGSEMVESSGFPAEGSRSSGRGKTPILNGFHQSLARSTGTGNISSGRTQFQFRQWPRHKYARMPAKGIVHQRVPAF